MLASLPVHARSAPRAALPAALFAALLCGPAAADWRIEGRDAPRAWTEAAGARLSLGRDAAGRVALDFTPAGAFTRLADGHCPTLQVDANAPVHLALADGRCALDGARARIALGTLAGRTLVSRPLYEIMNGTRLAVRYQTAPGGYGESVFSLRRSARAIRAVLGRGVQVRPR